MNDQEKAYLDSIRERVELLNQPQDITIGTPEEREAKTAEYLRAIGQVMMVDVPALLTAVMEKEASKNQAYWERNQLVRFLSKLFPSWLDRHPAEETWEDDWRWIVMMMTPNGQLSWHIHDTELSDFDHLPRADHTKKPSSHPKWDGHNFKEKYERLFGLKVEDLETKGEQTPVHN